MATAAIWKEAPGEETLWLPQAFAVPVLQFTCTALKFRNFSGLPVGQSVGSKCLGLAQAVA